MGRKDKKKGKGAVKTAVKTENKKSQKHKKELAAIGEEDVEKIVAQIECEEKKKQQVTEDIVSPPSPRANFTLVAHPDKDELILFGGEYFNGQKTFLYNDLFFYSIVKNEWLQVSAPGSPPPRCGHQMLALSAGKGQLWVFGGEYASPTQAQFYHYKDLWVFHLASKKWEKINAQGGPSARSGHRMVCIKKQLIVFGGFHDNLRDYKYFNDVYAFNLENYSWKKLEPSGTPPAPRSGCQMAVLPDGKILVFGGYSKEKIKKDVDKGSVHTDMFLLSQDKNDATGTKWKWSSVKQSGARPSPRCSFAVAMAPGNSAYVFGGVWDVEENEEELSGTFFNDLYTLELDKSTWRTVTLSGKKDSTKQKRRRRKDKGEEQEAEEENDKLESEDEIDEVSEKMETVVAAEEKTITSDDGIFKVTVGPASSQQTHSLGTGAVGTQEQIFFPSPRMNAGLALKHGVLYLYGGLVEDGDRQLTLSDFYSLDIHKLDEWKTIIPSDLTSQEWLGSESESDDDDDEDGDGTSGSEEDGEEIPMETD